MKKAYKNSLICVSESIEIGIGRLDYNLGLSSMLNDSDSQMER